VRIVPAAAVAAFVMAGPSSGSHSLYDNPEYAHFAITDKRC